MTNATFSMTKEEVEKYLKVRPGFFNAEQLTDWVTDNIVLNFQKIGFPESEITVNITAQDPSQNLISISRKEAEKYLEIEPNFFSTEQIKDWVTDNIVLNLQEIGFPESEVIVDIIEKDLDQIPVKTDNSEIS
ncbi:hypothetical protein [Xenorhabdus cabanillasii]|uniref:Uncharacterized protein n=1 Tax=Xenorhabdus cabanillasii JM26 TaxID=1427517 RepID=W1IRZ0_9GAMM|nr:hypothetical protein [Xenorhabdus cabanillasii]PHM75905.1 hypothetical protein Xcab_03601 [Xenorhabdus cabanillasii JM26]CDL79975.1 hypothetical protein XCR1_1300021 [Xenorhabdus cabanillasii JM26]